MIFLPALDFHKSAIAVLVTKHDEDMAGLITELRKTRTKSMQAASVKHATAWVERVATLAARLPDTSAVKAEILQGLGEALEALARATGGAS